MEDIRYINPLSDKEKELRFGVRIENISHKEVEEKYGYLLTDEQKRILGINK